LSQQEAKPLVTIGLPVYNEARFIDAALASVRRQDYPNLEIVVSDNASTDATLAICERHAGEDARIRIERAAANRGATANFQHTLDVAGGTYFMWAGGHDLWSANFVSACVARLQANPDASLAFGNCQWIGADERPYPRASGWTDTRGLAPVARLITIFWGNMHPVVGLIRTDALRACAPLHNMAGGDLVLLSELALRGDFVHATQATWSRREFRAEAHHDDKLRRYASADMGITRSTLWRMFPLLQLPFALMRVVMRSDLPMLDKLALMAVLLPSFPLRYLVGRRSR